MDAAKNDLTIVDPHKFIGPIANKEFSNELTSRERSVRPFISNAYGTKEEDINVSTNGIQTQHIHDRRTISTAGAATPRGANSSPKDSTNGGITKVDASKNKRTSCWKSLQPVIYDLYIVKNHTLQEVYQRLKQDHNFHASYVHDAYSLDLGFF